MDNFSHEINVPRTRKTIIIITRFHRRVAVKADNFQKPNKLVKFLLNSKSNLTDCDHGFVFLAAITAITWELLPYIRI